MTSSAVHAVGDAVTGGGETVAQAAAEPVYWNYGAFIQQCIDFTILAFCVFMMVKLMNRLMKKKEEEAPAPAAEPVLSKEEQLLTEIRDLLKRAEEIGISSRKEESGLLVGLFCASTPAVRRW